MLHCGSLDPIKLAALAFPALQRLLPFAAPVAAALVALYCLLETQAVSRLLPRSIRRLLANPDLHAIILFCAHESGLANEVKRLTAVTEVEAWLKAQGIAVPDHYLNLLVEMLVHQMKADGLL